ncbi:MAG: response regulator transcription factor [Prolixibacteraceae bacterium]|jgi:DNA-binding NarL/FixJ family response regulator|nr:response regulator transcription factor [Prolixibacteraceae bacterium]
MSKKKIFIVDQSEIIRRGIGAILRSRSYQYEIIDFIDSADIQNCIESQCPAVLLINPTGYVGDRGDRLKMLRQNAINFGFKLIAVVYAYFDEQILSLFDDVIYINDDEAKILSKLEKLTAPEPTQFSPEENNPLSQRELDVIRLVALGRSNREIAEELFISIHTVISHRKNITAKLGIKSASGLTIYAVINKLISSGDFNKTI